MVTFYRILYSLLIFLFGLSVIHAFIKLRNDSSKNDLVLNLLKEALVRNRPIEARISGGIPYSPYFDMDDSNEKQSVNSLHIDKYINEALPLIYLALREENKFRAQHILSRTLIIQRNFSRAEEELQGYSDLRGPEVENDLGVIFYEKAKINQNPEFFSQAINHYNAALKSNSNYTEALFNRAQLYQSIYLKQRAKQEWQHYISLDSSSGWKLEAHKNLIKLQTLQNSNESLKQQFNQYYENDTKAIEELIKNNFNCFYRYVDELLEEYIQGINPSSDLNFYSSSSLLHSVEKAHLIAEIIKNSNHDNFLMDKIKIYEKYFYKNTQNSQAINLLKQARLSRKNASNLFSQGKTVEAYNLHQKAKKLFHQIGMTFDEELTNLDIISCLIRDVKTSKAIVLNNNMMKLATEHNYLRILAKTKRNQGQISTRLLQFSKAAECYKEALNIFQSVGDIEEVQLLLLMIGNTAAIRGDINLAFENYLKVLLLGEKFETKATRLVQSYIFLSLLFKSIGNFDLALAYAYEANNIIQNSTGVHQTFVSYINSLLSLLELNNRNKNLAVKFLEQALSEIAKVNDFAEKKLLSTDHALIISECQLQLGDYKGALKTCTDSISIVRNAKLNAYISPLYRLQGIAYLKLQSKKKAENSFSKSIYWLEIARKNISNNEERTMLFDSDANVYDFMALLQLNQLQNSKAAFSYIEASKARTLLDEISFGQYNQGLNSSKIVKSFSTIQSKLLNDSQVLEYLLVDNFLITWVVTMKNIHCNIIQLDLQSLEKKVTNFFNLVSHKNTNLCEIKKCGSELFQLLVKPVESHLDLQKRICFIPDKFLYFVPWGALITSSGQFLIEDYQFSTSPSLEIFLNCQKKFNQKNNIDQKGLLAIGDPDFDSEKFSELSKLNYAKEEVVEITKMFSKSKQLVGSEATKEIVCESMSEYEIVHFATHCLVNKTTPLLSSFILAENKINDDASNSIDGDQKDLHAYEIYKCNFTRTRLVVLANCNSGLGFYSKIEGIIGMTHPFLSKGVPSLLVSLWSIDDQKTYKLMVNFYANYRQSNLKASACLRLAQISLIKNNETVHPFYWAAFTVIGF